MSIITDTELMEIYSNAPVIKDTFQVYCIYASWFSEKVYFQNRFVDGVDVTLEDDTEVTAIFLPVSATESGNNGDMSYSRSLVIQAVNDRIAHEISLRDYDSDEYITVETRLYVMYRNGLSVQMKNDVITTKVSETTRNEKGTSVSSTSTPVTLQSTGERVSVSKVPMIKGWL